MAFTINGTSGINLATQPLTGVLPDANAPSGSVLQVLTNRTTSPVTSTSTSYTTLLTQSITPISSSSKILVKIHGGIFQTGYSTNGGIILDIDKSGGSTGSDLLGGDYVIFQINGSPSGMIINASIEYLDSPNTTSSVTYTIKGKNSTSGITFDSRVGFGITLMEIAG